MRAITMRRFGGPEVLELTEVPDPQARAGHLLVDVTRAGVNYADVHVRGNTYLAPISLPYIPGNEIVGITADGRRIAALTIGGGYAEKAVVHRRVAWDIPDDVTDDQAAALALQGNTAWHLLFTAAQLTSGQSVVIPAAAGGVGCIAVQLAKQIGAKVIALASTEAKRRLAMDLGADAALDSSTTVGLTERILDAAGGPVHAALEMTGGPTLQATLAAVAPRGRLAVYGYASGESGTVPTQLLMQKSISVSGFWLPHLYSDRNALPMSMKALTAAVRSGDLRPVIGGAYPLAQAAQAHRDLAARTQTGKLVLTTAP
ncbi:quinone oxidoreductase family protein [Streptantibioticus ferralitis]|uniref:Zinc-binding dehydrogenase n=1 Tax=Streptantibioticus ferralitis TaxID=236510 RepID=A0ABT5YXM5_9ACTN|nr:zinc-binding dehydrogenase [Streptantibioticus ferralitis]MDF2256066.1 zinc-binding dehydrogenase [Streptantibioticus ferralitis]